MVSSEKMDLSSILSSQARFRVLEAVVLLTEGVGLRELERRTRLGIRSVQLATHSLIEADVLKKNTDGGFSLNTASPLSRLIQGVFRYIRDEKIREHAKTLTERARRVLRLSDEVRELIMNARRPN